MARKLDPVIADALKSFGFGPDAAWDCHGTWVVYHRVLEQIAAKGGIRFEPPMPLETNGAAKSVAICVTGHMGDKAEWSIGEASPANNKNGYPYAMAEKRAKDRVILKLIGLHGLAYSEDEADDFKGSAPAPSQIETHEPSVSRAQQEDARRLITAVNQCESLNDLDALARQPEFKGALKALPPTLADQISAAGAAKRRVLTPANVTMAG
ncbi:trna delta -isopentenylpyrophosphate transferase [Ancylobacter oerskovii]|uniref:Trna delta -isopentenylpyrophosphate transferase n=1 Tax=Ancylobacter oerskovii TaxID=459519 RepID=A0ABW4Z1J8_9HYPH|nr:trna delta -isopentenylpyrophosphate transferase [Ancylobacter oerskovii]MBS7545093.1 trna delta -isopentenylpyrophosphate transferase [Ancylobacter oerskovii]